MLVGSWRCVASRGLAPGEGEHYGPLLIFALMVDVAFILTSFSTISLLWNFVLHLGFAWCVFKFYIWLTWRKKASLSFVEQIIFASPLVIYWVYEGTMSTDVTIPHKVSDICPSLARHALFQGRWAWSQRPLELTSYVRFFSACWFTQGT